MKNEVLEKLFAARSQLSELIFDSPPAAGDPAAKAQLLALMQRRDRLTAAINQTIAADFNDTAHGLDGAIAELEAKTGELAGVSKKLDQVNKAVQIADEVVKQVGTILKLAAVV